MQSQDTNTRSAGAVNHPSAEEWMAYLYHEVTPERERELRDHVAQCAACGRQFNQWRAGMVALDDWKLPATRRKTSAWQPATVLKWAAAAAIVLCVGIAVGRISSSTAGELAELKTSVARLTEQVNGGPAGKASNEAVAADTRTREELIQLLADYSKLDEERRTEDRRVVGLALRDMDLRLGKLRTELETVALNTESGFRQTKEGLSTLASYTVADHGGANDLKAPETKN